MKYKLFFKIYILVFILEISIVLLDVLFYANSSKIGALELTRFSNLIVAIISFPINLLGRNLPFYALNFSSSLGYMLINVFIHSLVVFSIVLALKKKLKINLSFT